MSPVVFAAVAVGIGTGVGSGRAVLALPAAALAIALAIGASLGRRHAFVVGLLVLACASAASASWRTSAADHAVLPTLVGDGVLEACGTVQQAGPRSAEMRIERIERRATAWRSSEPLRISGADVATLRAGEYLCATGTVVKSQTGIKMLPLLVADEITERRTGSAMRFAAGTVRARFSEAAQRVLPDRQAGLLLGMTDGDTALLDEATIEAFRTTGLAHLVAVSGSNVAVVVVLVMLAARRLSKHRWMHVAVTLPALAFFAFLTGLEASVLRAVVTAGIALLVTLEGRLTDGIKLASFAFIVLVLATPELLFHPGFQLSFAATLGLILWGRPLKDMCARYMPVPVAACIGTTLAAQAAAAPLLALHFGRIPAVGGIANLVVAPLAPVVMVGGIATLTAASLVPALSWTPVLMRLPLDVILWCGRTFSELPSASLTAPVLVGVAITCVLAGVLASSTRVRIASLAGALVAVAATAGGAIATGGCDGDAIVALDVGQGTAVLLRSGDHAVLVDGGPEDGGVVDDLAAQDIDRLDAVFVSHPHADHTKGVVQILEAVEVGAVYAPVTIGWGTGAEVVAAAKAHDVQLEVTSAGDAHRFGPLEVEVVSPEPVDEAPPRSEDAVNAFSLVLRARVGGIDVLMPGDIGAAEEQFLLDPSVVGASVLVAPHHGSKDLDPAFVEAVDPRVVLVTVGEDNRYGHPAPEAMRTYAAHAQTFRTDTQGTVEMCFAEGRAEVVTEEKTTSDAPRAQRSAE